jgi:hypothetical protein
MRIAMICATVVRVVSIVGPFGRGFDRVDPWAGAKVGRLRRVLSTGE